MHTFKSTFSSCMKLILILEREFWIMVSPTTICTFIWLLSKNSFHLFKMKYFHSYISFSKFNGWLNLYIKCEIDNWRTQSRCVLKKRSNSIGICGLFVAYHFSFESHKLFVLNAWHLIAYLLVLYVNYIFVSVSFTQIVSHARG